MVNIVRIDQCYNEVGLDQGIYFDNWLNYRFDFFPEAFNLLSGANTISNSFQSNYTQIILNLLIKNLI